MVRQRARGLFHLLNERRAIEPEQLRRSILHAAGRLERTLNKIFFKRLDQPVQIDAFRREDRHRRRRHSMGDFEALSEQGVTTVEAALYYTLFHHLTREITIQGRLLINARHRVCDKRTAARAAAEDLCRAERAHGARDVDRVRPGSPALSMCAPWVSARPALKKAS